MKKEEIIEVLRKYISHLIYKDGRKTMIIYESSIEAIADELQAKELSDEEIEKEAKRNYPFETQPKSTNTYGEYFNYPQTAAFKEGAKWYREQIKQL